MGSKYKLVPMKLNFLFRFLNLDKEQVCAAGIWSKLFGTNILC